MNTVLMSQNLDGDTWNSPYNDTDLGASHWFINYRDSLMVPSISSIYFGFSIIQYVILVILLVWRRNRQPVKSRDAFLIFSSLTGETLVLMNISARYMVGWWKYPCFLYALTYSVVLPFILLPGVLRAWRLIYVYKLNSMKKLFSNINKKEESETALSNLRFNAPEKNAISKRKFAIWKFWVSSKFIALVFLIAFLIHVGFFIVTVFVSGNPRLFISFKESCEVNNAVTYIGLAQAFTYFLINLILVIFMIILRVKDTWSIRNEALFVLSQWIFFCIIFLVFGAFFFDFYVKGQRYWPYGYFIVLGIIVDLFSTCWIPIIKSFLIKRVESGEKSDTEAEGDSELLHTVLNNEDFRAIFRKYCERSFCPEIILFWEENLEFMKLKTDAERRVAAKNIIERYLNESSPLELNLPNREIFIPPIKQVLEKYEAELVQNSIPVGSNLLAEIGANIVAAVFGEVEGSTYKQAFINQLSRVQLAEVQMLAANFNNSSFRRTSSFYGDEITNTQADEDSSIQSDLHSAEPQTNTEGIKRHSKSFRLLKKLQKKKKKVQEAVHQELIPPTLFRELILHDEHDMLDIFARFKTTKEFKKYMDDLKAQKKLELIVS
jgi:predicted small integral membrane protein